MELRAGTWFPGSASGGVEEEGSRLGQAVLALPGLVPSWTVVVVLLEQWSSRFVSCLYRGSSQGGFSKGTQRRELPGLERESTRG